MIFTYASMLGNLFRQLYEEIISELRTELHAALVDLGHKNAFDLLLKEAWNPESRYGKFNSTNSKR
jgi:predicted lipid-binding transport protein (Tim44 family)